VQLVAPGVSPAELAARIDAILSDPVRSRAMRDAAWEHAAGWQFGDVAAALMDVVERTLRAGG
jgi:hypothetical protein